MTQSHAMPWRTRRAIATPGFLESSLTLDQGGALTARNGTTKVRRHVLRMFLFQFPEGSITLHCG